VGQTGLLGKIEQEDLWGPYRQHVLKFMKLGRKVRVVVDAQQTGWPGKMVPAVFGNIPDLEIIPVLFEITGSFVA